MKMSFSSTNLEEVGYALELAMDEIHNQIATCPDVYKHADEIEELRKQQARIENLRARVFKKLGWDN